MIEIAEGTKHSTRTVARHLKELREVKRLDLRKLGTTPKGRKGTPIRYPKNAPKKVFYQIETLGDVPHPYKSFIVHKNGRFGPEAPKIVKGPTEVGKKFVDEDVWYSEGQYKIKSPWDESVKQKR